MIYNEYWRLVICKCLLSIVTESNEIQKNEKWNNMSKDWNIWTTMVQFILFFKYAFIHTVWNQCIITVCGKYKNQTSLTDTDPNH